MGAATEASSAKTALGSALDAGLEALVGSSSPYTFTLYKRLVLPADGFVFWVLGSLVSPTPDMPLTITVNGSLHFSTDKVQDETEVYGLNRCVFTSEHGLGEGFNQVGSQYIYIGEFTDPLTMTAVQYAFSSRQEYYQQAGLWHYVGDAVYPFMGTQVVNSSYDIPSALIVSNSLPVWLYLNDYTPTLPSYGFGNTIPLFPSHLVPPNTAPPYATVHVEPSQTEAFAAVPALGPTSTHTQMSRDVVKVTFYGVDNADVMTFYDCVLQFIGDYQQMGLLNSPVVRDEKRAQRELGVIAQKKSITFEVSYYQSSVRDIARQAIVKAIPVAFKSLLPPPGWPPLPDPCAQPSYTGD